LNKHGLELFICGLDELEKFRSGNLTDIISICDPNSPPASLSWFKGERLTLFFGDVISEADAKQCRSIAPAASDIQEALTHCRQATASRSTRLLVHCNYGASRSPALAYAILADYLGLGNEKQALETILEKRPQSVPNMLVVSLSDRYLQRGGALITPLKELFKTINQSLSAQKTKV